MKVNLFNIFKEEIFPFVSLDGHCFDLEGNSLGESSADFWWKKILEFHDEDGHLNKRSSQGGTYVHDT